MENTKKENIKKNIKKPSLFNTIQSIPEAWRTRKSIVDRKKLLKRYEGKQNNRNKLFKNTNKNIITKPRLSGTNNSNVFSTILSKTNNNNINNTEVTIPKSPYASFTSRKHKTRKQTRSNRKK